MDDKTCSIIKHFDGIVDPRMDRRKLHNLMDIIVIALCATIAGCDSCEEYQIFGKAHLDWLKTFLELPYGIPSHDTFERVFARIDPKQFQKCFASWTKSVSGVFSGVIAIDGQTHRGAKKNGETKSAVHMVSAWAAGLRMVIAQTKVGEKTNEITAIPEVIRLLDLKGCIVTIDAMGCQQAIARQIIDQGGDYILGLKGNQGLTLEAVEEHFSTTSESVFEIHTEVDKGHGRIEDRKYYASEAKSVCDMKEWPGINSVIKVTSSRELKGVKTTEDRFYISSMKAKLVQQIGDGIRAHWGVENSLHYVLDVTFRQDKSRMRTGNAAENLGVLRHLAMNILRGAPESQKGTPSINLKRRRAAMDLKYLDSIVKASIIPENTGI
jgi:predicted transposase YbfD/YdcC